MLLAKVSELKRLIQGRAFAYNQVFSRENKFTSQVLSDLAKFCRAHDTTFSADPRMHAVLEGRREVWLRIQEYLKLDLEEIYKLHKIKEPQIGEIK